MAFFSVSYCARPWLLLLLDPSPLLKKTPLSSSSSSSSHLKNPYLFSSNKKRKPAQISIYYNNTHHNCNINSSKSRSRSRSSQISLCRAAAKQQQNRSSSVRKRPVPRKKGSSSNKTVSTVLNNYDESEEDFEEETSTTTTTTTTYSESYLPSALPKPPAGFVLDPHGKVLMVSSKRIATIVDSTNNLPLECVIRRVFRSSQGDECMLLCPVDTPVQIVKSTNIDGWSAVEDEKVETILPAAAYALAKIHMHLVISGFCYTARGGFCYSEEDIFEIGTDNGQDIDGVPTEGVEITCFHQDGVHYMIYTPSDPLLFVAVKDNNGLLQIADDDLLEDPAIIDAIDEETEFNALAEEEAALLESLLGER